LKNLFILSASLLGLSQVGAEDNLLQPLDLERVVIRGRARIRPAELPKADPKRDEVIIDNIKATPISEEEKRLPRIQFHNTFNAQLGRHNHWSVFNSLLAKRNLTSTSLAYSSQETDGFRKGYSKKDTALATEWNQRTSSEFHLKAQYSWDQRSMGRPNPVSIFPSGDTRKESIHHLRLKFSSPHLKKDQFNLLFEHINALQENDSILTTNTDYRYQLNRIGLVTSIRSWEAALSLEFDKKDKEQTTLGRLFFKHSKHILDHRTALHLGLGAYALSSRESSVNPSGFFTLKNQEKNSSIAFSPYIQLDHNFTEKIAFYSSYTQFYERQPILDVFFDQPITSRPSNIIQPSFNIEIESGLRWDLGKNWKLASTYTWRKSKDQVITIVDSSNTLGHLSHETWNNGSQGLTKLELQSKWKKHWLVDLSFEHLSSHWEQQQIAFTPFIPDIRWRCHVGYDMDRWAFGLNFSHESGRMSYPNPTALKELQSLDLQSRWSSHKNLQLELRFQNVLNHESETALGYPTPPWNAQFGVRSLF
jgi:outer membrane receptor protein involved in Fe transport